MDHRNDFRYHKMGILSQSRNWIMIGALALGVLLLGSVEAHAQRSYLNNADGFTDVYANTQGTRLDSCIVCHDQNSNGGRANSRNPYGDAWDAAGGSGDRRAAFIAIEGANSDGVGGTNKQEIDALTFPGDPNDPPPSVNQAPTANAGPNQTVTAGSGGTASVTLNGSGSSDSDPGDSISSYSWSGPFGAATGATPTVSLGVGTHSITLTVQDTNGGSDTDIVQVTVNAATPVNGAPSASNDSYSVDAGSTLGLTAPGVLGNDNDPDNDSLTAVLASPPSSGTFNLSSNGSFNYTPSIASGSATFTYRASDGSLTSNVATVTITVNAGTAANQAPILSAIGNKSGTVGSPVTFTASATDPNGNSLTFSLVNPPTGASINPTSGAFTWTPTSVGSPSVTVRVTDNGTPAMSDQEAITVTVTADTEPPPPPATGDLSVSPADGEAEIPITTTVMITTNGSALNRSIAEPSDIATIVNPDTFTLMEDSPVAITSRDDDEDHSQCVTEGIVNGSFTYTDRKVATFTPLCTLKESITYTATITPPAGVQQSVLADTMVWSFTTIAMTPDSDDDGDPDAGDESPHDCRNATPGSPKGNGKIKMNLDGPPNGCFKKIKATSETDPFVNPTGMPSGYEFRDGIIAYEIVGISTGETDTVTLTYPEAFPAGSKVYKVDSSGFYEYPDAVIDGSTVTLTLTDGGSGDSDLQVNGVIVDPIGVAVPNATGSGSIDVSNGASGGGCSVVGTGGGWKEAAGSYGLLALAWLGLALRRRNPETGK